MSNILSVEELQLYLGKLEDFPLITEDFLREAIWYAESKIQNLAKRDLLLKDYGQIISGRDHDIELLLYFPVFRLISIFYRTTGKFNIPLINDITNESIIDYETGKLILINGKKFPTGIDNIKINYRAGFDPTSNDGIYAIPKDIKGIVYEIAAHWIYNSWIGEKRLGLTRRYVNPENYDPSVYVSTVEYATDDKLEDNWRKLLLKYTRFR